MSQRCQKQTFFAVAWTVLTPVSLTGGVANATSTEHRSFWQPALAQRRLKEIALALLSNWRASQDRRN